MPGGAVVAGCLKSGAFSVPDRWSLWIVGRWQLLLQIPGGSRPREPRSSACRGVWTSPRAYAAACSAARAIPGGSTACGPVPGGLQWGQLDGHLCTPVRRGCRCGGHFVCLQSEATFTRCSSEALGN
ncbi:G-patch domain family protein [Aspergillus niger]|uniref:G-patch domain family protein n=1 Tax=Aspergillus niger TaxID=5061 RepID=A0A505HUM3_ASPNG|nr:G-patch domain family protein [Aspergillus niger]